MKPLKMEQIHVATAITLQHGSVNSASMLTKGNLAIGVMLSLKWHNQKDCTSTHHLDQGKDEHELYMQMTEGYIRGTSTMHVRVTSKGQSINQSISTDVSPILEVILTYLIQAT